MTKKIYMIEARSVHSSWYAVQADEMPTYDLIHERIQNGTLHELSQAWQGDTVESIVELTEEEFLTHPVINYTANWKPEHKKDLIDDLDEEIRYDEPTII